MRIKYLSTHGESNMSVSNKNGREVTLSVNESIQTGKIDDDDIDELENCDIAFMSTSV